MTTRQLRRLVLGEQNPGTGALLFTVGRAVTAVSVVGPSTFEGNSVETCPSRVFQMDRLNTSRSTEVTCQGQNAETSPPL